MRIREIRGSILQGLTKLRRPLVLALLVILTVLPLTLIWIPSVPPTTGCGLSHNAAWIGVEWTSQPINAAAVAELARDARDHQMSYLYPFTTYLKADGTFNDTYQYATDFVTAYRMSDPDTQLLAWIGLPLVNDRRFGIDGWVNLNNSAERREIVDSVTDLMTQASFDGVHIDAETVQDDDPGLLLLMAEVRAALGPDALLSIAGSYWLPDIINNLPWVDGYKWSGDYYRQVASHADQIATMTYDSLLPHPALYRIWMRAQTCAIDKALSGSGTELLIGISASRERTLTHRPFAENTQSGLAGACAYLTRNPHRVSGFALYASWEAEPVDWSIWNQAVSP